MAKEKASVESLVKDALVKLATSSTPMRISGKGDPPALFASASGANKEAIARLQAADNPLICAVGSGKSATVKPTAAGLLLVLPNLSEETVGGVATGIASEIPTAAARIEFLQTIVSRTPLATAELLPVLEETRAAERAETEARLAAAAKRREAEEASLKAIERWTQLLAERRQDRVAALRRELEIEGETLDTPASPRPKPRESLTVPPTTEADHTFRRQAARRLVSSWLQQWRAGRDEGRQALEIAMGGMTGFRRVGEVGDSVRFDGATHECERSISDGAAVKIVRPGWELVDDDGPYTLAKALVE